MKNIWLLTKVQLGTALDFNIIPDNKKNKKKKPRYVLYLITILFVLLLSGTSFFYSFALGSSLKMIGAVELLPELMMAITSVVTLITTIYKVRGTLFGFKDYDIVMSLPVKTSEIVGSRLMLLYLINIVFAVIIMIPNNIAYGILVNPSPVFYVYSILAVFLIPLIPMIVASIIGTLISIVAARFRHSNIINIVICFVLLGGFMIASFSVDDSKEALGKITANLTKSVNHLYPLAGMYKSAVCDLSIVMLLAFIAISLGFYLIASWLFGINFKKINTSMASHYTKSNYKLGKSEQASPFKALYQKELRKYFSSTLYVMNTAIGMVMMTMASVATLFLSPEKIEQVMEIPNMAHMLGSIAPIVISMCVAMTYITACSISLEGKNLWILKVSPVSSKTIFASKAAVNLTITIPPILLNSIIMAIGLKLSFVQVIILFAMPIAYAIFTALFGLVLNLKFPNLNWTTEVTVIKQSAAAMIGCLGGLVISAIPIALIIIFANINSNIINGVTTLVIAVFSIVLYQYLIKKGGKILQSL